MSGAGAPVAAVVLAAGSSRRMGQPKQLLPWHGRPLLQHVLDVAAASAVGEIVLVLGHEADGVRAAIELPARGRIVVNERHAEGQGTSLACGVAALGADAVAAHGADAVAVLLGDQPGVSSALVDAVVAAFLAGDAAAVRPVWRGADGTQQPGHPVVLARRVWPEVAALTGDRGARDLFAEHPDWLCELAMAGDAPTDIDDPADYRRAASGG
jgi:molybdenum cofactor cytidylyltransferase